MNECRGDEDAGCIIVYNVLRFDDVCGLVVSRASDDIGAESPAQRSGPCLCIFFVDVVLCLSSTNTNSRAHTCWVYSFPKYTQFGYVCVCVCVCRVSGEDHTADKVAVIDPKYTARFSLSPLPRVMCLLTRFG